MIEGDKLYVNNINKSTDEFTVLGYGPSAKVNLSRRSCNCRKYDLVKLPCTHAMAALRLKHGDEYNTSIYNYSSPICSKESYLLSYLEPICAAPLESEWRSCRRSMTAGQGAPTDDSFSLGHSREAQPGTPSQPVGQRDSTASRLPPESHLLNSGEDPQLYLREVRKIIQVMHVLKEESVELASYRLKGIAYDWVVAWKKNRGEDDAPVSQICS
ncbi:hypothetical protein BC332_31047 [Capsicum chinense]|nr:hypothetical protein BC332_31047 [Capsicum chinense]